MKILKGLDGSICGTVLSNRPPTVSALGIFATKGTTGRPRSSGPQRRNESKPRLMHITAAASCPQTASWLSSTFLPKTGPVRLCQQRRHGHAAAAAAVVKQSSTSSYVAPNKADLLAVVDARDDIGSVEDHLDLVRDPYMRRYAQPDGPELAISDKREDIQYPSPDQAIRGDPRVQQIVEKLRLALSMRLRHPGRVPLNSIYKLYSALPQPRMLNLPAILRHRLLKVSGNPTKRDSRAMMRYFSIIAEVKDCGLTLSRREWNSAMAFAGQFVGKITDAELESALQLWGEMEKTGRQKANGVTFNILFDAAAKSGNFELAERIYQEMESRGLKYNRYHRVSLIHFFGLKADGDGIRAAYKEMVDAGEIIDAVVLNCLVASFFRAGDEAASLRVYEHMKSTTSKIEGSPLASRQMDKAMTQVLMMFSEVGRQHPSMRSSFQGVAIAKPNLQTYRILLDHYAWNIGDLNRVVQFLDEMSWFEVPIHGGLFLILFKGFAKHGGSHYSRWDEKRLRNVFESLLQSLDAPNSTMYVDTWLAGWALRAFMKCAGKDAVMEAFDQLQTRWKLSPNQAAHMDEFLHEVLRDKHPQYFRKEEARRSRKSSR